MRFKRLRRIIRIVRIVEMHPDEKRSLRVAAQPVDGAFGNVFSAPFDAVVAVFAGLALMKMGVIQIEAAVEAGGRSRRIENIGPDERRSR